MEFFLLFLLTCLFGGILLHKVNTWTITFLLAGFCVLIMLGYFFFNLI